MTRVASWPSGLNVGPVATRARNPSAITTVSHSHPLPTPIESPSVTRESTTTPAATDRAASSLTGFGK